MHDKASHNTADLLRELAKIELFSTLSEAQLAELVAAARLETCSRGQSIITEGETGDSLYLVLSGRFEVRLGAGGRACAQIGAGQPIGEVGFIAGLRRTATVTAIRESIVLVLEKARFDSICAQNPSIWQAVSAALARRLAASNAGEAGMSPAAPTTITIIPAGKPDVPPQFAERFAAALGKEARVLLVGAETIGELVPGGLGASDYDLIAALNALEAAYDHVVYLSDADLSKWSSLVIRQADLVLSAGLHSNGEGPPEPLNPLEAFARAVHGPRAQRLALLHRKKGPVAGTARWLEARDGVMHHHLCLDDEDDYARLVRFIRGEAVGFVGCGGGALSCAHLGIAKALAGTGIRFDMLGGTSGGAAMTGAFAIGQTPDEVARQTHEMFVTRKALGRYNLPVFSLLDHRHFDAQLEAAYGSAQIEDCWLPYFALATDLSNGGPVCIRRGAVWQAIRASAALPALLPPFYTQNGEMLADGGLSDNVPVAAMREIKDGPNFVVSFEKARQELFDVDYRQIPSRLGLMKTALWPQGRAQMRKTPLLADALTRALLANRQDFRAALGEDDILLALELPPDAGLMDWHKSALLMRTAHDWTKDRISALREAGDPVLAHIDRLLGID